MEQDLVVLSDPVIDDPDATLFSLSWQSPSQLSDSDRPFDDVAGIRSVHQVQLQHVKLRVIEVVFSDTLGSPDRYESVAYEPFSRSLWDSVIP